MRTLRKEGPQHASKASCGQNRDVPRFHILLFSHASGDLGGCPLLLLSVCLLLETFGGQDSAFGDHSASQQTCSSVSQAINSAPTTFSALCTVQSLEGIVKRNFLHTSPLYAMRVGPVNPSLRVWSKDYYVIYRSPGSNVAAYCSPQVRMIQG